jgi:DNA-binding NarL/FixJ family response regulator
MCKRRGAATLAGMGLRCLIVDDNAHFLEVARNLLEQEGLAVVGLASTSDEALRRAEELRPDVALVDVYLGDESGFEVARRLAAANGTGGRVILISTYPEAEFADLIVESPAVGFLSKSALSRRAIDELLEG